MKQTKQWRKAKITLFAFCVAIGLLAVAVIPPYLQQRQLAREVDRLSAELEQLKVERQRLEQEKERLSTDAYVEQVARRQLGFVKPGEVVVVRAKPGNAVPLKKDQKMDTVVKD